MGKSGGLSLLPEPKVKWGSGRGTWAGRQEGCRREDEDEESGRTGERGKVRKGEGIGRVGRAGREKRVVGQVDRK